MVNVCWLHCESKDDLQHNGQYANAGAKYTKDTSLSNGVLCARIPNENASLRYGGRGKINDIKGRERRGAKPTQDWKSSFDHSE